MGILEQVMSVRKEANFLATDRITVTMSSAKMTQDANTEEYKKEFEKEFEKALEKAGALEFLAKSLWSLIKKLNEDGNGNESDKTVIEIGGKVRIMISDSNFFYPVLFFNVFFF